MALKVYANDKMLTSPMFGSEGWARSAPTQRVLVRTMRHGSYVRAAAPSSSWPASDAFLKKVIQNGASNGKGDGATDGASGSLARVQENEEVALQAMEISTSHMVSLHLPKPLSITDLSLPPRESSDLRVAYQGVPGAYSEAAAAKAYPRCEAVPCEQFEAAFSAVELWLVDRAVLPVENSLGGSIHRNYDLLLRHRLHIVGEVRLFQILKSRHQQSRVPCEEIFHQNVESTPRICIVKV